MHEETGRLDIKWFADVFTDLDPILAALTAGTGFRFVEVFDAWQGLGQGLTTGTGRGVGGAGVLASRWAISACAAARSLDRVS